MIMIIQAGCFLSKMFASRKVMDFWFKEIWGGISCLYMHIKLILFLIILCMRQFHDVKVFTSVLKVADFEALQILNFGVRGSPPVQRCRAILFPSPSRRSSTSTAKVWENVISWLEVLPIVFFFPCFAQIKLQKGEWREIQ